MSNRLANVVLLAALSAGAAGQEPGRIRVEVRAGGNAVAGAMVVAGRYTRILSDGLPLYGSRPGGLGLLQIPPTDLGQVEVIKGVASALDGAGAMGGVVNLLSGRRRSP